MRSISSFNKYDFAPRTGDTYTTELLDVGSEPRSERSVVRVRPVFVLMSCAPSSPELICGCVPVCPPFPPPFIPFQPHFLLWCDYSCWRPMRDRVSVCMCAVSVNILYYNSCNYYYFTYYCYKLHYYYFCYYTTSITTNTISPSTTTAL